METLNGGLVEAGGVPGREIAQVAAKFAALGNESRVRILRLLLSAHPRGMVAGEIQREIGMPGSTLSHHLEKLKACGLAEARRDRRFLWYRANVREIEKLLGFLFAECCRRNPVIPVEEVIETCRRAES